MNCQICGRHPVEVSVPDGHGDQLRVCGFCEAVWAETHE